MSCSMAGIDKCLNDKEFRKRKRETEAETRRLRVRDQEEVNQELAFLKCQTPILFFGR